MDPVQLDEIMNSTAAMLLYSQECEPDNMDDVSQVISGLNGFEAGQMNALLCYRFSSVHFFLFSYQTA